MLAAASGTALHRAAPRRLLLDSSAAALFQGSNLPGPGITASPQGSIDLAQGKVLEEGSRDTARQVGQQHMGVDRGGVAELARSAVEEAAFSRGTEGEGAWPGG